MLRLKEQPREWQKFTAVMGLAVNLAAWLLWWRDWAPLGVPLGAAAAAGLALGMALIRPRWFRGFYRGGMTVSFHVGQVIGNVLLTLFFFLVVTPMGLALRLAGKDLLEMRQDDNKGSRWREAKRNNQFDRMY